jgi:5-methylcytosine-specific restriction protein A
MIEEQFNYILDNYLTEKFKPIQESELALFIRRNIAKIIIDKSGIDSRNQYLIYGSHGAGNWAEIPWVGIFDREITKSAQKGFYIVYLFDSQMHGVFLSLNQGWTQYEEKFGVNDGKKQI